MDNTSRRFNFCLKITFPPPLPFCHFLAAAWSMCATVLRSTVNSGGLDA
jgi:hypothetical protein